MAHDDDLLPLLLRASQARIGLIVETSEPAKLRNRLYPVMRKDPQSFPFSLILPPVPNQVWIVKKDATNGKE